MKCYKVKLSDDLQILPAQGSLEGLCLSILQVFHKSQNCSEEEKECFSN